MKNKKVISLLLTLAIILGIVPIATISSDEPSVSVQLMARTTYNENSALSEKTVKGDPIAIDDDGDYSVLLSDLSSRSFTDLAIRSVGTEFGSGAGQLGTSTAAPEEFEDVKIEITSIEATGTTISLKDSVGIPLVSTDTVMQNRVAVQLWNAYYAQDNRIGTSTGITNPNVGKCNQWYQDPNCVCTSTTWESCPREVFALVFPNATTSIKVNFTVSGLNESSECDVCGQYTCVDRECVPAGAVPVRLIARTTANGGSVHKGDAVMVTPTPNDKIYTATMPLPGGSKQIANFALRAPGIEWGSEGDEVTTAVKVPSAFNAATVTIISVTANSGLDDMEPKNGTNLPFISQGNPILDGYADIQFWNAWDVNNAHVQGVDDVDGGEWGGRMLSFAASTELITVKFMVSVDGSGTCEDGTCKKPECPVCVENFCPTCKDPECNGCLDVVLQARVIWAGGYEGNTDTGWDDFHESEKINIKVDDTNKTYKQTTTILQRHLPTCTSNDKCCVLEALSDIRVGQYGTISGDKEDEINPGGAIKNINGPFREVAFTVKKVEINEENAPLLDHYVRPWFIARDDDPICLADHPDPNKKCYHGVGGHCTPEDWLCPHDVQEGFASASVYNAWWEPHQLLKLGAGTQVEHDFWSQSGGANMIKYKPGTNITKITVEYSLCFTEKDANGEYKKRCDRCNGCDKLNCVNCGGCNCTVFDAHQVCGCAQCFPKKYREDFTKSGIDRIEHGKCELCGCKKCFPPNGKCGVAGCPTCTDVTTTPPPPPPPPSKCEAGPGKTPCLEYDCPICNKDKEWLILGGILGNDDVTIFDAMEILMYLVKVSDCVILKGNDNVTAEQAMKAAIISPEGFEAGEPTIFCFIEVLLYLVKMDGIAITGKHIAPAPKAE
ncbi:MAG: hypothetical protein FWF94_00880 [Oscillospiraceae bacterium]|nr:hypothetical protein [Oscillospiraceae bacterium]